MMRHILTLERARRTGDAGRTARVAAAVAREYEGTPIGDHVATLAERNVGRALREDARTHVGRMARG